ncbi:hypothetical protein NT26_0987 [Pseudorhizobium banfieldiae]|uniref:Uncharacterized protein n=1 Tax=Pseudorhizobium banfieldiae TaxID=1125847 RepID=L0ND38_9HYPH|nr:hypothetical protein [Pseudorhizobium banfieldiae]CAD6603438.1 hypothetical protein RNT25_01373 [arsenite-oxidising bacterium NT-25]CCF18711.1 hypothetical protein NT26_0987 [Pseudorhizobium banfieldiae]
MGAVDAWNKWWEGIGHVARGNRDVARTREAFEAGYISALEDVASGRERLSFRSDDQRERMTNRE